MKTIVHFLRWFIELFLRYCTPMSFRRRIFKRSLSDYENTHDIGRTLLTANGKQQLDRDIVNLRKYWRVPKRVRGKR